MADTSEDSPPSNAGAQGSTALLVLGMHRSGTSATTRMLNLLGVELGPTLMQAAEGNNETGFWENQRIVDAQEGLMAELGMRWDDPRALPSEWTESVATQNTVSYLREILDEEIAAPLFGVKDPRSCRLLPLWRPLLDARGNQLKILHIVRHPAEIARSILRRDGRPLGRSYLLWLRHQIEAVKASEGLPQVWVHYDQVMEDWREAARKIDETLDLGLKLEDEDAAREIDSFLKPRLRHHQADADELEKTPILNRWVNALYQQTLAAIDGDRSALLATALRIEGEMDELGTFYDETFAEWATTELQLRKQLDQRTIELDQAHALLNIRTNQVDYERERFDQHMAAARQEKIDLLNERDHILGLLDHEAKNRDRFLKHMEDIRTSFAWRLFGPYRRIKRFLEGRMGGTGMQELELASNHQLMMVRGGWRPIGPDPRLNFRPMHGKELTAGLVRLKFTFQQVDPLPCQLILMFQSPEQTPDFGEDSDWDELDAHMLPLPTSIKGPVEIVVRLPIGLTEVSLHVPAHLAIADVEEVSVERLSDGSATAYTGPIQDYEDWVQRYDTLTDADRHAISEAASALAKKPTISVVMPVYNPPPHLLEEAIHSVRDQLYPDWELCIADDASTDPKVREVLEAAGAADPRIKVTFREKNGHISAASNSALELATGEFVALLDHDDLLPAHALFVVADAINRAPEASIFYSDEDKISEEGERSDPYFKPDFNLELFRGQNHVSHLGVYRRSLLTEIGGFREGYEGSQDYDLALRAIDKAGEAAVRHIPHILYHWRILAGSVALDSGEKDYAHANAAKALRDHLERRGEKARVEEAPTGRYHRIVYQLPDPAPKVSIIIPTKDKVELLRDAVTSIFAKTDYPDFEIIIVDNGSEESETEAYLQSLVTESHGKVRILRDNDAFNYSRLNNRAAEMAEGEMLCLLNNDTEVISPGWLTEMVAQASRDQVGAVGAKLYYGDGRIQHAGVIVGMGGIASHAYHALSGSFPGRFGRAQLSQYLMAVTAACLVTPKSVWQEVGGLDQEKLSVAFNDVDYCLKLWQAGYKVVWTPHAELFHHESVSRGKDMDAIKRKRLIGESLVVRSRWQHWIDADPFFNPNLSNRHADFRPGEPPRVAKPWKKAST